MPPWILKAAVQGSLSFLPQPQRWNRFFQTYVTGSLKLTDEYFLEKWEQCERHVAAFERLRGGDIAGFSALELGTGWFPIIPVGLALNGASFVWSADQDDLLARAPVIAVLEKYGKSLSDGKIRLRDPRARERLESLLARAGELDTHALLAALGVRPRIGDARRLDLPAACADLLVSNNTLEHIPRRALVDILREFRRAARPGAVMSHFIDMADHYAGFDSSITVYHFLRFGSGAWSLFNNKLQYQNRLRVSDFRDVHRESGWDVIEEDNRSKPSAILRELRIASEFGHYAPDDLLVYQSWMTSRAAS